MVERRKVNLFKTYNVFFVIVFNFDDFSETAEVVFPNLRQHMDVPSSVSPQKRPYPSPLSTSKMEEPFQTIDFTTK